MDNPNPARVYPWDDDFDESRCNVGETGIGTTSAVGLFPAGASPYGVLDMSGNVWEWCLTKWVDDYQGYIEKERELQDVEGEPPRVVRGGSWYFGRRLVRCACRLGCGPDSRFDGFGFRVVVAS